MTEPICGIYKITNTIDGKVYIGQSIHIYNRWKQHKSAASNPNCGDYHLPLYQAIRDCGIDNFDFEIVETCSSDILNEREQYYIQYYKATNYNYGYNSASVPSEPLSREVIDKIIDLLENRALGLGEIAYISNVTPGSVRDINTGDKHYNELKNYPLRNPLASMTLQKMYQISCRPSIELMCVPQSPSSACCGRLEYTH